VLLVAELPLLHYRHCIIVTALPSLHYRHSITFTALPPLHYRRCITFTATTFTASMKHSSLLCGGHVVLAFCNPFFQILLYLTILVLAPNYCVATCILLSPFLLFPPFVSYRNRSRSPVCQFIWKRLLFSRCIQSLVRRTRVVKTEAYRALDPAHDKILLCAFPHGVMPVEMYCALEMGDTAKERAENDNVVIHTVAPVILNPLLRFLLVGCRGGFEYASKESLRETVRLKKRALLYPGGIRESLLFDAPDPVYRQHTGFLKFAVAEAMTLVPVFLHNEEKIVGNCIPGLTAWMYRCTGVPLSFPYWRTRPTATVYYGNPVKGNDVNTLRLAFYKEFDRLRGLAATTSTRSSKGMGRVVAASKTSMNCVVEESVGGTMFAVLKNGSVVPSVEARSYM